LKENGAQRVDTIVTHGLFTGDALERIQDSHVDTLTITDSLSNIQPKESGIAIIGIAEYISRIISKKFII
jgi:ribose-phosphate pyrophosphokinase